MTQRLGGWRVRFETPGGAVSFWNRYGSSVGGRIGQQVTVRYNPCDTTDAVIASGTHSSVSHVMLFLLIGAVFTAAGAAVTWFTHQ
ncbi:DUF3592 domain-containing protein [Krasilnikovia sp. M28-CT-15]|uniref:DUF3592 domain-containing protein n=1 Tax=Krasilnikovia sp. M28-CT-15 TaxID=3373540 RepID=UPI003876457D